MNTSFYTKSELANLGLKSFGENVLISKKCSIYSPEKITIGNNVRIDDFCLLSGNITLENYIHIAAYCGLFAGDAGIIFKDFSGLSSRCAIYAMTDDYSGNFLTNPMVLDEDRNIIKGKVIIGKHCVVGTGSTILPNVELGEGCSFGAMCLINQNTPPWGIYVGIPCKRIRERSKKVLDLEKKYKENY